MEYLDIYDEERNYLGKEERSIVHKNALWHNTVHCWLYDDIGNIYFQIRKDLQTFYTTASGHVSSGETLKEAFGREIKEEIGLNPDYEKAELIGVEKYVLDRVNKDGSIFRDRAFSNIFAYKFDNDVSKFSIDPSEVSGLVRVNAKDTLNLFNNVVEKIPAVFIDINNNILEKEVFLNDFLVNSGETAIGKYGKVLDFVIDKTNK